MNQAQYLNNFGDQLENLKSKNNNVPVYLKINLYNTVNT
jgi:hypothetical protein